MFTWLALAALMSASLAVLYRFAPDRKDARWRWITLGAMGATALWLATSVALFAYVQRLGTYGTTYGSLAGVAISMFWLWVTVLLIVVGAAVNGEAERQTVRDSTVGPERPLGERGAVVADTAPRSPSAPDRRGLGARAEAHSRSRLGSSGSGLGGGRRRGRPAVPARAHERDERVAILPGHGAPNRAGTRRRSRSGTAARWAKRISMSSASIRPGCATPQASETLSRSRRSVLT